MYIYVYISMSSTVYRLHLNVLVFTMMHWSCKTKRNKQKQPELVNPFYWPQTLKPEVFIVSVRTDSLSWELVLWKLWCHWCSNRSLVSPSRPWTPRPSAERWLESAAAISWPQEALPASVDTLVSMKHCISCKLCPIKLKYLQLRLLVLLVSTLFLHEE